MLASGGDRKYLLPMERTALFTLPNTISLSRLVLAAAFLAVDGAWDRALLIIAAGVTDFLDGFIARRGHTTSKSGALIDPLADRAFVLTAVSAYLVDGILTLPLFLIFLARDIATAVGFLVAQIVPGLRPVVFQARMLGKIVTVLQLITLVVVLFWPPLTLPLVYTIGLISLASIVDYTRVLWSSRVR